MNLDRMRYIYHLDDIKTKKNMTTKELCHDICSDRQYRKYLTGDNNISDSRITEFCDKLSISTRDFYYSLNKADIYEFDSIREIYNLLITKKYKAVASNLKSLSDISKLSVQNKRFLDYCIIRYNHELKIIHTDSVVLSAKKLAKYPECFNNEIFDFVDILAINLISVIEVSVGKKESLELLTTILTKKELIYLSSDARNMLPVIYSSVCNSLGRLKRYSECISVANAGIEYCNKYFFSSSLTWLYYSIALAHKHQLQHSEAEKNAVYCMANVIASRNNKNMKIFYKLLLDDFGKDPFEMILEQKLTLLDN